MRKARIITHNGHFHADDVFATALLAILHDEKKMPYDIIRSRDRNLWLTGDFVVDVGDVYDALANRFDHHQKGGAGVRENGVPYSSLGLVWKKFGAEFTGLQHASEYIDKKLVEYIDAMDNGMEIIRAKFDGVNIYAIGEVIESFSLGWDEDSSFDDAFIEAVDVAKKILLRERSRALSACSAEEQIRHLYDTAPDKRFIVLDRYYGSSGDILRAYPEPLFVIYPEKVNGTWHVKAVRTGNALFTNRKDLPKAWAGKRDRELAAESGVQDALFCHNNLFLAVAKSKEGAIALAEKAVIN
ncbi:MAG: metal-dependent hydrolase [Candidatus Lloydbacteria bacterium CG22_combo_CG10-13_8_21_14_all_47_15]|uniref:Metal-dependent hydrolase n=1 Tax=Candidatus Lloydbacteria bacterium CG22_combo_CG10-13_8_21_14_all_47_15 TaxID=1974635 RepID=A0A2H0CX70_9BACT|nr:MAG: metal-dependent hydrolase [Candidatus Lloydbacteria bacterium CG22_combo_CG10-13_8_21_14_all_47_15]